MGGYVLTLQWGLHDGMLEDAVLGHELRRLRPDARQVKTWPTSEGSDQW